MTDLSFASFLLAQLQMDEGRRLTAEQLLQHPFLTEEKVSLAHPWKRPLMILHGDTGLLTWEGDTSFYDLRTLGEDQPLPAGFCFSDAHLNFLAAFNNKEKCVKILDVSQGPLYQEAVNFSDVSSQGISMNDKYLVAVTVDPAKVLVFKWQQAVAAKSDRVRWERVHSIIEEDLNLEMPLIVSLVGNTLTLIQRMTNTVLQFNLSGNAAGATRLTRVDLPFKVWSMFSPAEHQIKTAMRGQSWSRARHFAFEYGDGGGFYAVDLPPPGEDRETITKICSLPSKMGLFSAFLFGANSLMVRNFVFHLDQLLQLPAADLSSWRRGSGRAGRGRRRPNSTLSS